MYWFSKPLFQIFAPKGFVKACPVGGILFLSLPHSFRLLCSFWFIFPPSTLLASAHSTVAGLRVALFNARSVGTPERRCDISTDIDGTAINLMFLTETQLHSHGDEAKIADVAPPSGYAVKSFTPLPWGWNGCHLQDQPLFSPLCQIGLRFY